MTYSCATVVAAAQLNSRLRRITLRIDDPGHLGLHPAGDAAVTVYLPTGSTVLPPSFVTGADGARHVDPAAEVIGRNYTVRRRCDDRIDLDIVLRGGGPGTTWARTARPGDRVGLGNARSWYRPEPTTDWQLLAADLSGLSAAARIIDELPDDLPIVAVVEVAAHGDLDYLPDHPRLTVVPSVGTGNGHSSSRLAQSIREVPLPTGRGYCWFAGEAAESRAVRKYLRGRGWVAAQFDVVGYWRADAQTWAARFALVADEINAVYERALAEGKSAKVADEVYDQALERAGL